MRWTPVAGLALALTLALAPTAAASPVLTLSDDGSVSAREDRYLPSDGMPAPAATADTGSRAPRAPA
ncbi:MAG: hypothetical protein H0T43_12785, partial [Solirubrobacterales bacterium]|nr:hypothetical protein [Solirubrobacterales bacterium]